MPKKGDVITTVQIWTIGDESTNYRAVLYTRNLRVRGWGKKEGHLEDIETGETIEVCSQHFRYVQAGEPLGSLIETMRTEIRRQQEDNIKIQDNWLWCYAGKAPAAVLAKARQTIASMRAGANLDVIIRPYNDLVALSHARWLGENMRECDDMA